LAPDTDGGAYSAPQDPLAGFNGALPLREGEWKVRKRVEEGRETEREGRDG